MIVILLWIYIMLCVCVLGCRDRHFGFPKRRDTENRRIGLPKCRDANSAFRILGVLIFGISGLRSQQQRNVFVLLVYKSQRVSV